MTQLTNKYPLVDSNILIDWFVGGREAKKYEPIFTGLIYYNLTILTETINFIQNKHSFKLAKRTVNDIFENVNVFVQLPIDSTTFELAIKIHNRYYTSKLGFSDCMILAQARLHDLTIFTQDQRMQMYKEVEVINPFEEQNP